MQEITVNEALSSFGLSEKEIKIYLACLELGTSTANNIANKADINRSTTYDILKLFLEKGITSKVTIGKTINFEVVSPEKLIGILEEKKSKLVSVLDKLRIIQKTVSEKPKVELYEGKEGLKVILQDILETKEQTDVISNSKIFKIFSFYFPRYIRSRKEEGIFARVIQEESSETKQLKKNDDKELRKTKVLKNIDMDSAIFIYGDKVATLKLVEKEPIGVIVKDKGLANDNRAIFEVLWNVAK